MIGWMPEAILPARKRALQDLCSAALRMVEEAGDTTSDAAKDLIKATADIQQMLRNMPDAPALKRFTKTDR